MVEEAEPAVMCFDKRERKIERYGDWELNPVIRKPVDYLISNGQNQTGISDNV